MDSPEYTHIWIADLLLDPDYRFLKIGEHRQEGDEVIIPCTELQVKVRKWDHRNGSLVQTKNDLPARRKNVDLNEAAKQLDKTLTPAERAAPTFLEWSDETIARCVRGMAVQLHDEVGFGGLAGTSAAMALVKIAQDSGVDQYDVNLDGKATVMISLV